SRVLVRGDEARGGRAVPEGPDRGDDAAVGIARAGAVEGQGGERLGRLIGSRLGYRRLVVPKRRGGRGGRRRRRRGRRRRCAAADGHHGDVVRGRPYAG